MPTKSHKAKWRRENKSLFSGTEEMCPMPKQSDISESLYVLLFVCPCYHSHLGLHLSHIYINVHDPHLHTHMFPWRVVSPDWRANAPTHLQVCHAPASCPGPQRLS
ncbi:hypothetical protein PoB_005011600 [Plakobranchus ocellatus]|uniref:Uncharacterized protein n=1 Tax=Plakobranchus ocellatus TaxID=259542 RepID=A0AAV4BWY7_9GAST|nr:hypothetical protein PoB_005011600 [Plakobranchus ocellatus]